MFVIDFFDLYDLMDVGEGLLLMVFDDFGCDGGVDFGKEFELFG